MRFVLTASTLFVSSTMALPPNKIVIVIEENHAFSEVIGNPDAPYINSLAAAGANLTRCFALTHPSQPNYLEFFSGDNQGVTENLPIANTPFSSPNLGANLLAAGQSFVGYCEDLPEMGSLIWARDDYARRHNPWSNWQSVAATPAPGSNQLPWTCNQPFSAFPSDFALLPRVSIIVPNNLNNMHSGSIAEADDWLRTRLGAYAQWAMANNSLLIVTWDEDESQSRNQIPTILYGPMVRPGTVDSTWTLHNITRTVSELCGASACGSTASVRPIVGVLATDPPVTTVSFRDGELGYDDTIDTFIEAAAPDASHNIDTTATIDGSPLSQGLIRFDAIFGGVPGRIPENAIVLSAKLSILTGSASGDPSTGKINLHRKLVPWGANATWNSLTAGVTPDDVEAASMPEFSLLPNITDVWVVFDVTSTIESWLTSPAPNNAAHGWALLPTSSDGWRWSTSESALIELRPRLDVTFTMPTCPPDFNADGFVDFFDYDAFVEAYELGDPAANPSPDFNTDGFLDFFDYDAFVEAYETGC